MSSIDELSTDDEYDEGYISTNAIEDIWNGKNLHTDINTRYARLKIRDRIKQAQSELEGSELPEKRMYKGLHKVFKDVVSEINN